MDGINVVIFLVHCTTGLLLCDTVPTDHLRFSDVETCRGAASALITARRDLRGSEIWMANCRYQLAAPDPRRTRQVQAAATLRVGQ